MTALLPPCRVDPISWDLDPGVGAPHIPVDDMVHACLVQCPRLERCRAEAGEDVIYGVVAGEYRPWPSDARVDELERSHIVRRLVAAIRTEVTELEFDDPLPPTRQLAREFGTSTTAVRAALRWLVAEDVLLKPATRTTPYRVAPPRKVTAA